MVKSSELRQPSQPSQPSSQPSWDLLLPSNFYSGASHPLSFLQQLGQRLPFLSRADPRWWIQLSQGFLAAGRHATGVLHGGAARITPGVVLGVPSIAVLPFQGAERTKLGIGSCLALYNFSGVDCKDGDAMLGNQTFRETNILAVLSITTFTSHSFHIHNFLCHFGCQLSQTSPLCTAASDHPDPTEGLVPPASRILTGFP